MTFPQVKAILGTVGATWAGGRPMVAAPLIPSAGPGPGQSPKAPQNQHAR